MHLGFKHSLYALRVTFHLAMKGLALLLDLLLHNSKLFIAVAGEIRKLSFQCLAFDHELLNLCFQRQDAFWDIIIHGGWELRQNRILDPVLQLLKSSLSTSGWGSNGRSVVGSPRICLEPWVIVI